MAANIGVTVGAVAGADRARGTIDLIVRAEELGIAGFAWGAMSASLRARLRLGLSSRRGRAQRRKEPTQLAERAGQTVLKLRSSWKPSPRARRSSARPARA